MVSAIGKGPAKPGACCAVFQKNRRTINAALNHIHIVGHCREAKNCGPCESKNQNNR